MSKILKNQNRGSFINQAFDLAPNPDLDNSLAGVQQDKPVENDKAHYF